jgi:hypothetical protein
MLGAGTVRRQARLSLRAHHRPADGPALSGLAYGAVAGGRLYLMSYTAPRNYFYAKHLAQVQAIAASARITIRETEASASP